jgi:type IV secretion system protein VirB10
LDLETKTQVMTPETKKNVILLCGIVGGGLILAFAAVTVFDVSKLYKKSREEYAQVAAEKGGGSIKPETLRKLEEDVKSPKPKEVPTNAVVEAPPTVVNPNDPNALSTANVTLDDPTAALIPKPEGTIETPPRVAEAKEDKNPLDEILGRPVENAPIPQEVMAPRPPVELTPKEEAVTGVNRPILSGRYLFQNRAASAASGGIQGGDSANLSSSVNIQTFAPESHEIDLILMDNIISDNTDGNVRAAVLRQFRWNGRPLLQPGDMVIGTVSAGDRRRRVRINWTKILLKDGRTLPIQSIARMPDGTPGVEGYKIGNVVLAALGPILADFIVGATNRLAGENQTITSFGQTVSTTSKGGLIEAAYSGAGKAFERLRDLMLEELDEEKPYIFVPAGTECRAYLLRHIDLSQADYAK